MASRAVIRFLSFPAHAPSRQTEVGSRCSFDAMWSTSTGFAASGVGATLAVAPPASALLLMVRCVSPRSSAQASFARSVLEDCSETEERADALKLLVELSAEQVRLHTDERPVDIRRDCRSCSFLLVHACAMRTYMRRARAGE